MSGETSFRCLIVRAESFLREGPRGLSQVTCDKADGNSEAGAVRLCTCKWSTADYVSADVGMSRAFLSPVFAEGCEALKASIPIEVGALTL